MKFADPTRLDSKSGEVEGSAVRSTGCPIPTESNPRNPDRKPPETKPQNIFTFGGNGELGVGQPFRQKTAPRIRPLLLTGLTHWSPKQEDGAWRRR
jgi:hypothetical protein